MAVPVKCTWDGCDSLFSSTSTLNRHIRNVHKKQRSFICSEVNCNAAFSSAYDLKRHNISTHLDERNYKCSVEQCNAAFSTSDRLKRHNLSVHLGERNHACSASECNAMFSSAESLKRHKIRFHQKEKYFKCSLCTKSFFTFGERRVHENSVHGTCRITANDTVEIVKPSFLCSDCGFQSSWKEVLKRHISRMHSDYERLKCHDCGCEFTQKYNLKRHILSKHCTKYCGGPMKEGKSRCLLCEQSFQLTAELDEHYVKSHGVDLNTISLSFSTMDEFLNWKKDIEDSTITRFVLKSSWKNKRKFIYSCHRSGRYIMKSSDRKRAPLRRGSKKLNGVCPASITLLLNENDSSCIVTFTQTHIGHSTNDKNELKFTFLRKQERQKLAGLLASGISKRQILDQSRSGDALFHGCLESNVTRNSILSNKDLCNVEASYKAKLNKNFARPQEEYGNLEVVADKYKRNEKSSVAKRISGKITSQQEALRKAHKQVLDEPEISIELTDDGDGWLVPSFETLNDGCLEMYVVRKIRDKCPVEENENTRACNLICAECQECAHKYSCTCPENDFYSHMCKHIHAVVLCLRANSEFYVQQSLSEDVEPMLDEDIVHEENDVLLNEEQKSELVKKFLSIAEKISTVSEKNIALRYLDQMETALQALRCDNNKCPSPIKSSKKSKDRKSNTAVVWQSPF